MLVPAVSVRDAYDYRENAYEVVSENLPRYSLTASL